MKFLIRLLILLITLGIVYLWMRTVTTTVPPRQVVAGQTEVDSWCSGSCTESDITEAERLLKNKAVTQLRMTIGAREGDTNTQIPEESLHPVQAGMREEPRRTSITLDSFLHVQQLRKKQLGHFCNRVPHLRSLDSSGSAEHLLSSMTVSHKLMTLYCKPEDVTINGWDELVQAMEARSDVTIRSPLPVDNYADLIRETLANYNATMLARVLHSYTKVLFVGDPFDRLMSLYMQGNAGEVSFEDFIEDILMMEIGEGGISSSSVVRSCYPCFVQYDYIVMFDYLKAELPHLIRRIGLPESVELPPSVDLKVVSRWLSENLFRRLGQEKLKQLSHFYSWDFAAFPLRNSLFKNTTIDQNAF